MNRREILEAFQKLWVLWPCLEISLLAPDFIDRDAIRVDVRMHYHGERLNWGVYLLPDDYTDPARVQGRVQELNVYIADAILKK